MRLCITIDTEMSMGAHKRGATLRQNFDASIAGRCPEGEFGAFHQARELRKHGLAGVFFVDPLPTLNGGRDVVRETVETLIELGQDVQLHVHTEWLDRFEYRALPGRSGDDISDYDLETQTRIVALAAGLLVGAGAPFPTTFRAGNYGANDDTLTALARNNIPFDSSFDSAYGKPEIDLPVEQIAPVERNGVVEFPLSAIIEDGHRRHLQVCAVTEGQMRAALTHAAKEGHPHQTMLSHSFELLTRDRKRANPVHVDRFRKLCEFAGANPGLFTTGPFERPATVATALTLPRFGKMAALRRKAEQAVKNLRFERSYIASRLVGRQSVHWGGGD